MSESALISRGQAIAYLTNVVGETAAHAERLLDIARQYGHKAASHPNGIMDVYCTQYRNGGTFRIVIPEKKFVRKVAPVSGGQYTSSLRRASNTKPSPRTRRETMAQRRGAAAVAEPEVEETEEATEKDYTAYATKEATPTMADFTEWLELEVFGGEYPGTNKEKDAFADGVRLGGTLRMEFQRSPFNQERREERRNASATAQADEPEEEAETEETPKPARRGAAASKAPSTAKAGPTGAKSAPARRGAAKAPAEAPF